MKMFTKRRGRTKYLRKVSLQAVSASFKYAESQFPYYFSQLSYYFSQLSRKKLIDGLLNKKFHCT